MPIKVTPEERAFMEKIKPYRKAFEREGIGESEALLKAISIGHMEDPPADPNEAIARWRGEGETKHREYLNSLLFRVWDKEDQVYADTHAALIAMAQNEEWANHLMVHDMEGWLVDQEGGLVLTDECGGSACPPSGRFEIKWQLDGRAP